MEGAVRPSRAGVARDPRVNTMFQIAKIDDGGFFWVNGDQVTEVVK